MSAYDIVEANGRTWRQNRLALKHNTPLKTLVEVEIEKVFANDTSLKGLVQMYVIWHGRDCDGSPLYWLSTYPEGADEWPPDGSDVVARMLHRHMYGVHGGYSEEQLRVVTEGSR
jgi:hypothetical protein